MPTCPVPPASLPALYDPAVSQIENAKISATRPQHRSFVPSEIKARSWIERRRSRQRRRRYVRAHYATMARVSYAPHQKILAHVPEAPTHLVPRKPPPTSLAQRSRPLQDLASRGNAAANPHSRSNSLLRKIPNSLLLSDFNELAQSTPCQ